MPCKIEVSYHYRPWVRHRKELMERQNYTCAHCNTNQLHLRTKKGRKDILTIDHIVKRADGGGDNIENLQLLCKTCHSKKDNELRKSR